MLKLQFLKESEKYSITRFKANKDQVWKVTFSSDFEIVLFKEGVWIESRNNMDFISISYNQVKIMTKDLELVTESNLNTQEISELAEIKKELVKLFKSRVQHV